MSRVCLGVGTFLAMFGCLGSAVSAQVPVFRTRIVRHNSTLFPGGVTSIVVVPGDEIEIDFFAADFSPNGEKVKAYQVAVDAASLLGPFRGSLKIKEGLRPCEFDSPDPLNRDCQDIPTSCGADGFCITGEPKALGAFIDMGRTDYIFFIFGGNQIGVIDYSAAAPRLGALLTGNGGVLFQGAQKYLGSLILVASEETPTTEALCERLTPKPLPFDASFLIDLDGDLLEPITESVTVIGPTVCDCTRIVGSNPPNCTIDARQLVTPDGSVAQTIDTFEFEFNCRDATPINLFDFELSQSGVGFPPIIDPNTFGADGSIVTVQKRSSPFTPQRWTCANYGPSGQNFCVGVLPADVDASTRSEPADMLHVFDCIAGLADCTLFQCDADHSGACTPADAVRVIDLLNGGDALGFVDFSGSSPWDGRTMTGACPSAP